MSKVNGGIELSNDFFVPILSETHEPPHPLSFTYSAKLSEDRVTLALHISPIHIMSHMGDIRLLYNDSGIEILLKSSPKPLI
jgi:hypothetical protein